MNKTLRLNNIKIRAAMKEKISVFVICVEAIIYLILNNLHDCTFKNEILQLHPKTDKNDLHCYGNSSGAKLPEILFLKYR